MPSQEQRNALLGTAVITQTGKQMANAPAKKEEGGFLTAFPMLAIPVVVYNIVALFHMFGSDTNSAYNALSHVLFSIPMPSDGTQWQISTGDVVVFIGLIMLFFEMLKSTRSDSVAIVNHSLSMILFILCLVEFLLLRPFGTSTFFLLTTMTLLDVLAGFIVTIVTARRDLEFG